MKIAILMNHNSYPGREYSKALINSDIDFDIISIGSYLGQNEDENLRCDNMWKPLDFDIIIKNRAHYNFSSLKSDELLNLLDIKNYDIGIQGGTGILKSEVINKFKLGILNFHPGDLPQYRGCSAPEWQIYEGKKVVSTCHLVDEGIDTGKIIDKRELKLDYSNYHKMRSQIYPQTAKFIVDIISEIISNDGFKNPPLIQDESVAVYRKYIGDDRIDDLKRKMDSLTIS